LLEERIQPTNVGFDPRIRSLEATPIPVDLDKALKAIGFEPGPESESGRGDDRPTAFRRMLKEAVSQGEHSRIVEALNLTRRLRHRLVEERIAVGAASNAAAPYVVDIWRAEDGAMVGLVFYGGIGFGTLPVALHSVETSSDDADELEDKLKQKLLNQARILQAFFQLFESTVLLSVERRRALPKYLKTLYEQTQPNRHVLLSRLRYAAELVALVESLAKYVAEADEAVAKPAKAVFSILSGLSRRIASLTKTTEESRSPQDLGSAVKEYERTIKYLNTAILHSINPWLSRQTSDLTMTFEFNRAEVTDAVKRYSSHMGLDWDEDVESFEAHGIRGTTGCRGLLKLADGSFKVVLLNYDRRAQSWKVRHMGPRVADVVRAALERRGRQLPEDYDEKFEQPTFHLDQQTCRFLLVKRGAARVEATLVLDSSRDKNPWRIVFLRHNDDVIVDGPAT
jgi:hypothetical protein